MATLQIEVPDDLLTDDTLTRDHLEQIALLAKSSTTK